ncbi:hypothetical protein ABK040_002059 [Willaertia magna]
MLEKQQFIYDEFDPTSNNFPYGWQIGKKPQSSSSAVYTFLSNISPTIDLRRISAPVFIVEPRTTLEKLSDTYRPCNELLSIQQVTDPGQRMLKVLRMILLPLCESPTKTWTQIKPLNPTLGEEFHAIYIHEEEGKLNNPVTTEENDRNIILKEENDLTITEYCAEQVSHHPPISCFHMQNSKVGFVYRYCTCPNVSLGWNSIEIKCDGECVLHLLKLNENYIYEAPTYKAKGIFYGPPFYNLFGDLIVECKETGFKACITFNDGEYSFKGVVSCNNETKYVIDGSFDKECYVTSVTNNSLQKRELFIDFTKYHESLIIKRTRPIHLQHENESRRKWHEFAWNVYHNNLDKAQEAKFKVEEQQRALERERKNGKEKLFVPKHFIAGDKRTSLGTPIFIHRNFKVHPKPEILNENDRIVNFEIKDLI